jgi:hypothetical protein
MMRKAALGCSAALLLVLVFSGCGRFPGNGVSSGPITAPFSMTLTDTPPAGVTVLFFQLNVTGAVLQPGNVSLINASNPIPVELTQLQTQATFLSSVKVPTGAYTSLGVTFANPVLTILNQTGAPIGTTCVNGAVCQLTPSISPMMVTFSAPLFPITLMQNVPVGFQVDVNLTNVIQSDLTINLAAANGVTLTQLPSSVSLTSELQRLEDVLGIVQTIGTNQFKMKTGNGLTLTINTDTNTNFNFVNAKCTANNFSCIVAGQILEVDMSLLGNSSFLAKRIEFQDAAGNQAAQGTIIAITSPTQFKMVVHQGLPVITNLAAGNLATVNLQTGTPGTTFQIDAKGLTLSAGLSFASSTGLVVGQEVQVRVVGTPVAGPPITFSTNRIALHRSRFTALVSAINLGNASFTVNNLPPIFPNALPTPILQIQVLTSSTTEFENLTPPSLMGLANGNNVSVEGLLFNTILSSGFPTMEGNKVRRRPVTGP